VTTTTTTKRQRAPSRRSGALALDEATRLNDWHRAHLRGRQRAAQQRAQSSPSSAPSPAAASPAPPLSKQLLDFDDLRALGVPWGRSRLYRVMAQGRFPRPVSTGPAWYDRKVWRRQDVERWLRKLAPAAGYATPAE
jgi:predicted DNA-binding transcriptional regulator AlpA